MMNSIDIDFIKDVVIMEIEYEDLFNVLVTVGGISVVLKFFLILIVKIDV